jgi:hypothetical protein
MTMQTDTLEAVQLGDTTEWIRVRATDAANPVLLLVQQGPGLPMLNEVRRFERLLGVEDHFTVVYWELLIPGTSSLEHLEENLGAADLVLDREALDVLP